MSKKTGIHGLGSVKKDDGKDAKDAKKHEIFSQSGAQSGTAVMRPVDRPDSETDVKAILNQATQAPPANVDTHVGVVTLYRNGFILGTGPFRSFDDPANKKFIEALKKGEIPAELEKHLQESGGKAGMSLVDKTKEDYKAPAAAKPAFQAFQTQGHKLASESKSVPAQFQHATPQRVVVDPNKPKTVLQIVLKDGKKVTQEFNTDHTVLDLYQHIALISAHSSPFQILAGYPPKPLADPSATIESAGLKESRVQQKL